MSCILFVQFANAGKSRRKLGIREIELHPDQALAARGELAGPAGQGPGGGRPGVEVPLQEHDEPVSFPFHGGVQFLGGIHDFAPPVGIEGENLAVDLIDEQRPAGRQALLDGAGQFDRCLDGIEGGIDDQTDGDLHGEKGQGRREKHAGRPGGLADLAPQDYGSAGSDDAGRPKRPSGNGKLREKAGHQQGGAGQGEEHQEGAAGEAGPPESRRVQIGPGAADENGRGREKTKDIDVSFRDKQTEKEEDESEPASQPAEQDAPAGIAKRIKAAAGRQRVQGRKSPGTVAKK